MHSVLGNKPIGLIKHSDLVRVRDEWLNYCTPATVIRRMALISNLYTVARKDWLWSYIDSNPVQKLRKPQIKNSRNRRIITTIKVIGANPVDCLTSETDWIIKSSQSKVLPTIIVLAIETAMRRSEIVNIKREHINFQEGNLFIPDSKNGESRLVPLSPIARYTLINYLAKNNNKNKLFNISTDAVSHSFLRAVKIARRHYQELCKKHDQDTNQSVLTDLHFHDLRHEATSRLASVYAMHELARITGHKDTRMLLRYYHPDITHLTKKLAQSNLGQNQFNVINQMLLQLM